MGINFLFLFFNHVVKLSFKMMSLSAYLGVKHIFAGTKWDVDHVRIWEFSTLFDGNFKVDIILIKT